MVSFKMARSIYGSAHATIACPLEKAFDYVGRRFFENYPRWSPQIVEFEPLCEGLARPGATARQVTLERGVRTESTIEISAFSPPHLLELRGLTEPFSSSYEFEPAPGGATNLSFTFVLEQENLFMRPFERLLRATLQEGAERTIDNLKSLLEGARAIEASRERLAQFVYVASLDLQEPLRKIEAFSQLLENAIASSNKADMAYAREAVQSCASTARKLVDDLLIYSTAIIGDQKLEIIDLRAEIDAALVELAEAIAETSAEIEIDAPPIRIMADRSQLACLLQNIVSNAIKYRKPGEPPRISVSATRARDKTIRLAIIDKGVGFREEFAQSIFEPFNRLPSAAEYAGAGIELAICKSIADRHGWPIFVKAQPGEGAAFTFEIPAVCEKEARALEARGA